MSNDKSSSPPRHGAFGYIYFQFHYRFHNHLLRGDYWMAKEGRKLQDRFNSMRDGDRMMQMDMGRVVRSPLDWMHP